MLNVVVPRAPRTKDPHWTKEYVLMLKVQRRTCQKFGHRQIIIGDADLKGFDVIRVPLPESLMHALVTAQLAWLERWDQIVTGHTVFVDADVLIARDLNEVFDGSFDIGFTTRDIPSQPINNGVMYVAQSARAKAIALWTEYLRLTKPHWGGDQEALAQTLAPVPVEHSVETRIINGHSMRVAFLPPEKYNMTPGVNGNAGEGEPFAVHFKGDKKQGMVAYADKYILT